MSFIVSMWPRSQKSAQHGPRILGFHVYVSLQQVYDPISKNLLWKLPHGSHPCIPILQAPSALSIGAFWSVFRSCCVCLRFLGISFSFQRCIRLNTHFLWTRGRRCCCFPCAADRSPMLPGRVHLGGGIFVDCVCVLLLSSSMTAVWGITA